VLRAARNSSNSPQLKAELFFPIGSSHSLKYPATKQNPLRVMMTIPMFYHHQQHKKVIKFTMNKVPLARVESEQCDSNGMRFVSSRLLESRVWAVPVKTAKDS
jgi:hypothetical protein